MKHLRNVPYVDLQRYGVSQSRYPRPTPPIRYGVDWLKVCGWFVAVGFSLSMWVVMLLAFLWWRS